MMLRACNLTGVILAALLACACANGTRVAPTQNKTEQLSAALSQRAARAFEQGDYRRAAALYEQALRLNAGVENTEGIAANALSLARSHQAAGDAAAAHRALDGLLADGPLPLPPAQRAEAQARKAQLHLDANEAAHAVEWSGKALASCSGCAALPAIQTLRGRAALAAGDDAAALAWATKALAATESGPGSGPGSGNAGERANALRLAGEARLARREHQAAVAPLEQALEIDRALGLPSRIQLDLMALGRAHSALGNRATARDYFARARSVSAAANDEAGVRAASRAMEGL
jgi:tetratricopeptide (TPR) repeat protein